MDHENAQFNVEEATERLFSFDHLDEHQEVSIGSVEKETKANKKKASKRDIIIIIVVDDKSCWPGTVKWKACGCVRGEYSLLTNRARGPYRGILARGRGSTDRAQRGPYKTTEAQYSPVRLELAWLVSSLLYGTLGRCLFVFC